MSIFGTTGLVSFASAASCHVYFGWFVRPVCIACPATKTTTTATRRRLRPLPNTHSLLTPQVNQDMAATPPAGTQNRPTGPSGSGSGSGSELEAGAADGGGGAGEGAEGKKFRSTKEELKARLSPIQYQVTQLKSTERPGSGEYNKFNKEGVYRCVVCEEKLFSSNTKYDSGCGWPAFFDAIDKSRLRFVKDTVLLSGANLLRLAADKSQLVRMEVLCANCNGHLGHRFDDGPRSKGGKRYCINSAALKFEPSSP